MKHLMTALLLSLLSAPVSAGEPMWAGVPLDDLPALELGAPTLNTQGSGWRAPLEGGGFVQVDIFEDAEAARAAFDFQRVAAFSMPQPELDIGGAVPAVGDGAGAALFVDRNVVVLIRDDAGRATERCAAIRGALEIARELEQYAWEQQELGEQVLRWDRYGRLHSSD